MKTEKLRLNLPTHLFTIRWNRPWYINTIIHISLKNWI